MEPEHFLSLGGAARDGLTAEAVARRLAAQTAPGRRRSPRSPEEAAASDLPRGDHDLNPDFYDPDRLLTPAAA